jgi:hypothetical protein
MLTTALLPLFQASEAARGDSARHRSRHAIPSIKRQLLATLMGEQDPFDAVNTTDLQGKFRYSSKAMSVLGPAVLELASTIHNVTCISFYMEAGAIECERSRTPGACRAHSVHQEV